MNIAEGSNVVIYKGSGQEFAHRPQYVEEDADADDAFMVMRNWLYNGLVMVQCMLYMIVLAYFCQVITRHLFFLYILRSFVSTKRNED